MYDVTSLHDGLFLRREALDLGYTDRDLVTCLKDGLLVRVRHGAYALKTLWDDLDASGRHLLTARAVLLSHPSDLALSHVSGAIASGLRVWGADLTRVHVVRRDGGTARLAADVAQHMGGWAHMDVSECDGLPTLSPAECALGLAATNTVESGLVTMDSLLDLRLATTEEVADAHQRLARWPGVRRLQVTLRLAQDGAESVGESRLRYLCWRGHLPKPELQHRVRDASGALIGTTDMAWPAHGVLAEFDGRVKFERFLRPGETASDAVFREKVREDRLREATGWSVVRFVWSDLSRPQETIARLRRQLDL